MSTSDRLPFRWPQLPRSKVTFKDRLHRVRRSWRLLVRLAVATGSAYAIARYGFGHPQPFFAPIAAVIALTAGAGRRQRIVFEMVLGVAFGVLVGELLIQVIGRGVWQIALVAALTAVVAMLFNLSGIALTQAVNSGLLLAAVLPYPGAGNPAVTRFIDALVGGLCGLAMVLLLPRNTVRDIDESQQTLLGRLASILAKIAESLRTNDSDLAGLALTQAREAQPLIDSLRATSASVTEVAQLAPLRWNQRADVQRYADSVNDLDNAIRDTRVLARRAAAMLRHGEQAPSGLASSVDALVEAIEIYANDFATSTELARANERLVEASAEAILALSDGLTINTASIAAQIRSLAADLLMAGGVPRADLDDLLDVD